MVLRGWREEEGMRNDCLGYGISLRDDEKVLELDSDDC
jgi:hypothetical protein